MRKINFYAQRLYLLILVLTFSSALSAQNRSKFTNVTTKSDLIVHTIVTNADSRWIDDSRGKHIYTLLNMQVLDVPKGNYFQNSMQLDIVGGTVGEITEVVSESFSAKAGDELLLFMQSNPLKIVNGNEGVFFAKNGTIFLDNSSVTINEFVNTLFELKKNNIEIKTNSELEKIILQNRTKIEIAPTDSAAPIEQNNSLKNESSNLRQTLVAPNLAPYKPGAWGDVMVIKKTTITTPIGTQLAADDSPLYDSDNLYLAFAVANLGDAAATSFNTKIYVDGVLYFTSTTSSLSNGSYMYGYNYSLGSLSSGTHTLRIVADADNQVTESNEADNEYTRSLVISHLAGTPTLTLISPTEASAGTGSQITLTGSGFGATRGSSTVDFTGSNGTQSVHASSYVSWSDNQIVCVIPSAVSSGSMSVNSATTGRSNSLTLSITFGYLGFKWPGASPNVTYKINENLSGVSGEGGAIQSGMSTWNGSGASFGLSYGGTTTATTSSYNGENSILFGSTGGSIATNYSWYTGSTALESDIIFNSTDFTFSIGGTAGTYDIQSIATHELGHTVGLSDLYGTLDADKMMYGYGGLGTTKTSLSSSDIAGAIYIYSGSIPTTYTITASAGSNGSISPSGSVTVVSGNNQSFTITPSTGYHVSNVLVDGSSVGAVTSYTFTNVNADHTIAASFAINTYTLTINATNGTVTKNPNQSTYNYGATVQLTATPNSGYTFSNWSGDASGSTNPLNVTMTANKTITANFSIITYTLTVNATNGTVTKNPNQTTYNTGSTVQLTATPSTGYSFTNWSGDATGTTNPLTVTMNSNKNITANFTINSYTLTVNTTNGSVTKSPDQTTYSYGSTVQLTATPAVGYTFTGWIGDATGTTNPLNVTIDGNKNITAIFTVITYTLSVGGTNGSVTKNPDQPNYNYGTSVQLTAVPSTGYSFTNWGGDASGSSNPLTVIMTANKNITASFIVSTYTLTVNATNGTVSKNPNQGTYVHGTTVQLTATPSVGYTFTGWSGDATGSTNPLSITMTANKNITANFALTTYTLTVNATNGTVTKNPDQANYAQGSTVQLTATPSVGYSFTNWSGDASGTTNPLTVTMDANKNITANFTLNTYTLTINAVNGTVTKNPNQATYDHGATVQLTAAPSAGYNFTGWSGDATGSTNPLTITMTANKNITANFASSNFTLTVTAVNGTVAKNPDQPNYTPGSSVQLTETPSAGYTFTNWSGDASGSANPLSVTMDGNKNITANFTLNTYTLNVSAVNGTVNKNPNQSTYNHGTTVELTAVPSAGYNFTGWGGDAFGSTNPLTVTMNANKNIIANFSLITYTLTINAFNGTVTKNPDQTNYAQGSTVQLTATPSPGYTFTNWSGDESGSINPLTITMNSNKNITANFSINSYSLTLNYVNGTISKNPDQTNYDYGTTVQLSAVPSTGYSFSSWSGDASGTTNPFSLLMNGNKNVTASFSKLRLTVTLNANPSGGGTVSGAGTFDYGSSVTITATPKNITGSKYQFINWTESSTEISRDASYTFTITINRNLTANFLDITSVEKQDGLPTKFYLDQNYPNPFNPSTKIQFNLPKESMVRLSIYNLIGEELIILINQQLSAGNYSVDFDGSKLINGVYFYKIQAGSFVQIKKMILMK